MRILPTIGEFRLQLADYFSKLTKIAKKIKENCNIADSAKFCFWLIAETAYNWQNTHFALQGWLQS